jgi:hypothetical protein
MRKQNLLTLLILLSSTLFYVSCQKESTLKDTNEPSAILQSQLNEKSLNPTFNLEVILRGDGQAFGLVKFRQDVDPSKIITLNTWVRGLDPNHSYRLQRAVDAINVVDGNCTSTNWLTLGKGLVPQDITTDDNGTGREDLWRDVSMLPSGSTFDIHFRVIDATTNAVVLTSDCYQYTVR